MNNIIEEIQNIQDQIQRKSKQQMVYVLEDEDHKMDD